MTVERRGSRVWGALLATALTFAGQAMAAEAENPDPWEGFNRKIFVFNDTLDTYALKPVAQGYQRFTPGFVQTGVSNFFNNLGDVRNLANDLLQGKVEHAGVDTARLLMNTTLGGLGLVDVATKAVCSATTRISARPWASGAPTAVPTWCCHSSVPAACVTALAAFRTATPAPIPMSTMSPCATAPSPSAPSTPGPVCCRPSA